VLPVIAIASILGVSVIGALQLRNDARLREKSFLELMRLTFSYLPILGKRENREQTRAGDAKRRRDSRSGPKA
jgi:hypothetical protein